MEVTWTVDCETEDTFLYAAISNISALGIFVRTLTPLAVGARLTLRFAPHGAAVTTLSGVVQWVNLAPQGPNPGMGIQFVDLTAEERERLVEMVRTIAYLRSSGEPMVN